MPPFFLLSGTDLRGTLAIDSRCVFLNLPATVEEKGVSPGEAPRGRLARDFSEMI